MFEVEADWLEQVLRGLPTESLTPCLDVGSSDLAYRSEDQPWIDERVFAPLVARGVSVYYSDLKQAPGIDLVADMTSDDDLARLAAVEPKLTFCCNILEHVAEPDVFASRLGALVQPGGRIMLTVPHRYPYHEDPIDNGFRPNVEEVTALFPDFQVAQSAILEAGSYREQFARQPFRALARHLARLALPFLSVKKWKQSAGRLSYLFRSYEVTCVHLVKREPADKVD